MTYVLILIATMNGSVTTIATPLAPQATLEMCKEIGEATIKNLAAGSDDSTYLCLRTNPHPR